MKYTFLSLFPQLIESYFADAILKRALQKGLFTLKCVNIRDYALDKYQKVDDAPISGGAGQVILASILSHALESPSLIDAHIVFLSPCGKIFTQKDAIRLSKKSHIAFVCGRYEGFDERAIECYAHEIFSIGDYILTGGELPALVMCDSITRHIKHVLGNADSLKNESFENALLESPNFAKIPQNDVHFLSNSAFFNAPSAYSKGNHSKIARLKKCLAICKTKYFRPDLYQLYRAMADKKDMV